MTAAGEARLLASLPFALTLVEERRRSGLSQSETALAAGLGGAYALLEVGQHTPTFDEIERVRYVLRTDYTAERLLALSVAEYPDLAAHLQHLLAVGERVREALVDSMSARAAAWRLGLRPRDARGQLARALASARPNLWTGLPTATPAPLLDLLDSMLDTTSMMTETLLGEIGVVGLAKMRLTMARSAVRSALPLLYQGGLVAAAERDAARSISPGCLGALLNHWHPRVRARAVNNGHAEEHERRFAVAREPELLAVLDALVSE